MKENFNWGLNILAIIRKSLGDDTERPPCGKVGNSDSRIESRLPGKLYIRYKGCTGCCTNLCSEKAFAQRKKKLKKKRLLGLIL